MTGGVHLSVGENKRKVNKREKGGAWEKGRVGWLLGCLPRTGPVRLLPLFWFFFLPSISIEFWKQNWFEFESFKTINFEYWVRVFEKP
jgi:hypothetical protein